MLCLIEQSFPELEIRACCNVVDNKTISVHSLKETTSDGSGSPMLVDGFVRTIIAASVAATKRVRPRPTRNKSLFKEWLSNQRGK